MSNDIGVNLSNPGSAFRTIRTVRFEGDGGAEKSGKLEEGRIQREAPAGAEGLQIHNEEVEATLARANSGTTQPSRTLARADLDAMAADLVARSARATVCDDFETIAAVRVARAAQSTGRISRAERVESTAARAELAELSAERDARVEFAERSAERAAARAVRRDARRAARPGMLADLSAILRDSIAAAARDALAAASSPEGLQDAVVNVDAAGSGKNLVLGGRPPSADLPPTSPSPDKQGGLRKSGNKNGHRVISFSDRTQDSLSLTGSPDFDRRNGALNRALRGKSPAEIMMEKEGF